MPHQERYKRLQDTKTSTCSTISTNEVQFFQPNTGALKNHLQSKSQNKTKETKKRVSRSPGQSLHVPRPVCAVCVPLSAFNK